MKLGVNSVLFGGYDMETAFKYTKAAGYDGIEISAIGGMSEHLVLDRWRECAVQIKNLAKQYELELLGMEQPSQDANAMEAAMQAAVEAGIPIINCGPGGKSDDEAAFQQVLESLGNLARRAERAQPQFPLDHHPAADPGSHGDGDHRLGVAAMAEPQLAQRRHARIVQQEHGAAHARRETLRHRQVAPPGQVRKELQLCPVVQLDHLHRPR